MSSLVRVQFHDINFSQIADQKNNVSFFMALAKPADSQESKNRNKLKFKNQNDNHSFRLLTTFKTVSLLYKVTH
jgi:hypothetical protein